MNAIVQVLVGLVALEHFYFFILESVLWTKPLGLKTFRNTPETAAITRVLALNQGVYNGFLVAGLVWALLAGPGMQLYLRVFFLGCVVVAGIVGGLTVSRRIAFIQAGPALVALVLAHL